VSAKRKKTVVRSIRLTKEIDDVLQGDAEVNGVSVGGLINRIMNKYAEWDRYADKFGYVCLAAESFRSILEEVDDTKLENVGAALGSDVPKSVTMFWFKKINLETLLKMFSLYGKYSGQFVVEIDTQEENYVLTLHHNLGKKWSTYLGPFMSQFVRSALRVVPHTEVTDNMVVINFHMNSS
jgi:hypothetical protein